MSHIKCPTCEGDEHVTGYGFAAGPLGGYTICDCGEVLELSPDLDGLNDEHIARIGKFVAEWRAAVWPNEPIGAHDNFDAKSKHEPPTATEPDKEART